MRASGSAEGRAAGVSGSADAGSEPRASEARGRQRGTSVKSKNSYTFPNKEDSERTGFVLHFCRSLSCLAS